MQPLYCKSRQLGSSLSISTDLVRHWKVSPPWKELSVWTWVAWLWLMGKQEQHLITSIMPCDLVAHGGRQFVYGWYLRHANRAEILFRLMGRTEGLDCQRSMSPHFSSGASEVPPVRPCYVLPPAPQSSVNGDWASWNMEAWESVN